MDLTINIGTFNNYAGLSHLLHTMYKYAPHDYPILVFNNNPEDPEEVKRIASDSPWENISVKQFEENNLLRNMALTLEATETDFAALLHDDITFVPDNKAIWDKLISIAGSPGVFSASPCTNEADGLEDVMSVDAPDRVCVHSIRACCTVFNTSLYNEVKGYNKDFAFSRVGGNGIDAFMNACSIGGDDLNIRVYNAGYDHVIDRTCFVLHRGSEMTEEDFLRQSESHWNDLIAVWGVKTVRDFMLRSSEVDMLKIACYGDGMDFTEWVNLGMNHPMRGWP